MDGLIAERDRLIKQECDLQSQATQSIRQMSLVGEQLLPDVAGLVSQKIGRQSQLEREAHNLSMAKLSQDIDELRMKQDALSFHINQERMNGYCLKMDSAIKSVDLLNELVSRFKRAKLSNTYYCAVEDFDQLNSTLELLGSDINEIAAELADAAATKQTKRKRTAMVLGRSLADDGATSSDAVSSSFFSGTRTMSSEAITINSDDTYNPPSDLSGILPMTKALRSHGCLCNDCSTARCGCFKRGEACGDRCLCHTPGHVCLNVITE